MLVGCEYAYHQADILALPCAGSASSLAGRDPGYGARRIAQDTHHPQVCSGSEFEMDLAGVGEPRHCQHDALLASLRVGDDSGGPRVDTSADAERDWNFRKLDSAVSRPVR